MNATNEISFQFSDDGSSKTPFNLFSTLFDNSNLLISNKGLLTGNGMTKVPAANGTTAATNAITYYPSISSELPYINDCLNRYLNSSPIENYSQLMYNDLNPSNAILNAFLLTNSQKKFHFDATKLRKHAQWLKNAEDCTNMSASKTFSDFSIDRLLKNQNMHNNSFMGDNKQGIAKHSLEHISMKGRKQRTIYGTSQTRVLEKAFGEQQYMVGSERELLAERLGLSEAQVRVWFQNRRSKWRKQIRSNFQC